MLLCEFSDDRYTSLCGNPGDVYASSCGFELITCIFGAFIRRWSYVTEAENWMTHISSFPETCCFCSVRLLEVMQSLFVRYKLNYVTSIYSFFEPLTPLKVSVTLYDFPICKKCGILQLKYTWYQRPLPQNSEPKHCKSSFLDNSLFHPNCFHNIDE